MRKRKGCAAIGFSAWFLVACVACGADGDAASGAGNSRQTIRVARKGGQSGMEGSCLRAPEPRPFSADDVRALIEGTRTTTLAYRTERRSPGSSFDDAVGLPMTVGVELQGEPRVDDTEPFEHCVFAIEQDVAVTLSFAEPALDVVIETTAVAFSSTFAALQVVLGSDAFRALGLPPRDVTFSLAFDASGIKGSFEQGECGRAVFPASVHCPDWSSIEVALNRQRPGVRPLPALSALVEELGGVPLEWSDGSQTTLAVSLAEAPEWACSGAWVETFCPENLQVPVSIRAVTADGRLDAELPAELEVQVAL